MYNSEIDNNKDIYKELLRLNLDSSKGADDISLTDVSSYIGMVRDEYLDTLSSYEVLFTNIVRNKLFMKNDISIDNIKFIDGKLTIVLNTGDEYSDRVELVKDSDDFTVIRNDLYNNKPFIRSSKIMSVISDKIYEMDDSISKFYPYLDNSLHGIKPSNTNFCVDIDIDGILIKSFSDKENSNYKDFNGKFMMYNDIASGDILYLSNSLNVDGLIGSLGESNIMSSINISINDMPLWCRDDLASREYHKSNKSDIPFIKKFTRIK